MAYVQIAELENYLKRSLTAKEASSFALIEEAARSIIDNYCDTNWDSTVTASSRYFDGGEKEIDIDPCKTITAVASVNSDESVSTEYDTDDYVVEPRNKTIKWSLRKRIGLFPSGISNIKVSAIFTSYIDEVPADVKLAAIKLMSETFQNPQGVKSESIEGYSYTLNDRLHADEEVKQLLGKYRQVYV